MLTAKELAAMLNGRQYRQEISSNEEQKAKDSGLVVVFGYSDDCVELRGVIDDEVGAYNGTTIFVSRDGKLLYNSNCCHDSDCLYYQAAVDAAITVEAIRHNGNPCWTFETSIPHETFSIFEDGELFCEGIVFSLEEVSDHKKIEKMGWISVNERMPEDDLPKNSKRKMIRCLVATDKGTVKPCVRQRWKIPGGELCPWQWSKDGFAKPTHWMLMPTPPTP